jgi:hypothetical protein
MMCDYTYVRGSKSGAICGKNVRNPKNDGKCYTHSPRKKDIKKSNFFSLYEADGEKLEFAILEKVANAKKVNVEDLVNDTTNPDTLDLEEDLSN